MRNLTANIIANIKIIITITTTPQKTLNSLSVKRGGADSLCSVLKISEGATT